MRTTLAAIAMMAFLSACNSATLSQDASNAPIGADSRVSGETSPNLIIPADGSDAATADTNIIKLGDPLWNDEELSPNSNTSLYQ